MPLRKLCRIVTFARCVWRELQHLEMITRHYNFFCVAEHLTGSKIVLPMIPKTEASDRIHAALETIGKLAEYFSAAWEVLKNPCKGDLTRPAIELNLIRGRLEMSWTAQE